MQSSVINIIWNINNNNNNNNNNNIGDDDNCCIYLIDIYNNYLANNMYRYYLYMSLAKLPDNIKTLI